MRYKPIFLLTYLLTLTIVFQSVHAQSAKENVINKKVDELISKMTLEEKIGQMTQVDYLVIKENLGDIAKYSIGSILWGGSSDPKEITPNGWSEAADQLQKLSQRSRLKIPLLLGIDAVHGHNNVDGAVIFPHNIGLGATRNPKLLEEIGHVTAKEIKGTGINWDFAPCVAVALNERWGRTYESFGEDPALVSMLGVAYVKGMQGKDLSDKNSTLACVKHYVGDGGTTNGKDQGNTECDEETLRKIHMLPYVDAIKAGAKSIMVTYNSWKGEKLHGHKYLLTDVLKNELGFEGFLISDWAAIDQLPGDYKSDIEQSINAGLDMVMIPRKLTEQNNYRQFVTFLKELVDEGKVPLSRVEDAARRILKVKFELGVFDNYLTDKNLTKKIGSKEHREVARDAVRQSLVLLKNENNVLPISKNIKNILVTGPGADDLGMQCGGWTISWQGSLGNVISGGTTILQAIKNTVSKGTNVTYSPDGSGAEGADVVIVVFGEKPYAEGKGDTSDVSLSDEKNKLVSKLKSAGVPVVTILLSGRPMIIQDALNNSDSFIAAWLPGTEGQGVADVLFGDFKPVGKLPHSWPRNMQQVPINIGDANYDPLFPYGYGLTY